MLVTLEDNVVAGGAGSAVNESLIKLNSKARILNLGLPDEFIEHGVNGYIVPDGEIIDKVVFLLKNKELLLRMSKESYKKYHELYKSNPSLDWYRLINR